MHGRNIYATPKIAPNFKLKNQMREKLEQPPFWLDAQQQSAVEEAVREVCQHRNYVLQALNAENNHVHAVVTAQVKPEIIANAFKSYATRKLRELNLVTDKKRIWSRGRSRRYLWEARDVALAIEYVLYGQGDILIEDWDED